MANFYIKNLYECPITDIIIENHKGFISQGFTELKLPNGDYIFFRNKSKIGRLYIESNLYFNPKINSLKIYDSNNNNYEKFIKKPNE